MKYILRLDDICPTMDWDKFHILEEMLSQYPMIKPIIGVIPRNEDANLVVNAPRPYFWDHVRQWRDQGWCIAQHGYCHRYTQQNSGILGIGDKSEFAGLSFSEQYMRLQAGKKILSDESVWQPYFMAPSHSFDLLTLEALAKLGFDALTDGYGLYPYQMGRLTAVPQLFSSGFHAGIGIYTVCLHPNTMGQSQFNRLNALLLRSHKNFIDFPSALRFRSGNLASTCIRKFTELSLKLFRGLKRAG
jgi:predicted deacetylase